MFRFLFITFSNTEFCGALNDKSGKLINISHIKKNIYLYNYYTNIMYITPDTVLVLIYLLYSGLMEYCY